MTRTHHSPGVAGSAARVGWTAVPSAGAGEEGFGACLLSRGFAVCFADPLTHDTAITTARQHCDSYPDYDVVLLLAVAALLVLLLLLVVSLFKAASSSTL